MAEKTTTRFGVDITDLKKGMQDATQIIKLTNSEFKNATAGMDDWSSSADGLSAKVKQLSKIEEQQQKKLEILKEEYRRVVEAQGENSEGARTLATEINNQEAVVKSTHKELQNYNSKLEEITTETVDTRNELEKLEDTIADQENQLKQIEREYQNAILTFGETSEQAQALKTSYEGVSRALEDNRNSIANITSDTSELSDETDNLAQSEDKAEESTSLLADGYNMAKDVIADFIKNGIQWAIDKFKELMSTQDEAMKSFQAQTGTATEDMSAYNDEMQNLYKQGYGETLTDVADAMAQVKQTTSEVDPSKLSDMTKNAMLLGETYEFDVAESLRAVNMLTDQFGVTSQEAYNLIVQGCQKGLNKNDDLLDTINEYGVHYKQLGYSADEFLNSLLNGTDAGTFSVDKLGDAMKEFGIRVKDNSDSTISAFKDLGIVSDKATGSIGVYRKAINDLSPKLEKLEQDLKYAEMAQSEFNDKTSEMAKSKNAEKIAELNSEIASIKETIDFNTEAIKLWENSTYATMESSADLTTQFAAGGDEAKEATDKVLTALFNMEDSVKQNEIGVALFGAMWEDLSIEGIKALTNVNGEIDKTNNAMSQIEDLKLSDVNSQLEVLGRTAETDVFMPIINMFLPYIKQGISWLSEKIPYIADVLLPKIQSGISAIIDWINTNVVPVAQTIIDWIQNTLIPLMQNVIDWIQINLLPVIQALFQWIIDNKDAIISTLVAIGIGFLAFNIVTMIQNVIAVFTALATVIQLVGAKQLITNAIMNANPIGILIALITGLIAYFVHLYKTSDEFRYMCQLLWDKIKEIAGKIKDKVGEIWDFFVGFGEYLYDWIHTTIPNKLSELWGNITGFISNLIGEFTSMKDRIFEAGQNLVEGLWNGIGDKFNWITGKIQEFTGGILDGIKDFFGIHSPSKLFETDIGYNLVYGLANGITKKTSTAVKSMTDLAKATVSPFSDLQANVGVAKNNLSSGLSSSSGGNSGSGSSGGTTLNFYQTNTSPKSLSRLEIYRQTRNQLNLARAVI